MRNPPRGLFLAALAALCLIAAAIFGAPFRGSPAHAAPAAATKQATQQTFLTFYGWWDNTPPGGGITYPQIHQTAGGTGTYSDPITYATSSHEAPPGTIIWVPRVGKYFIMEDDCTECDQEWTGKGPNGGPGLWHFDLWTGGQGGSGMKAIECENALTHYNSDGTPTMEPVVINPPNNEPYDPMPLFNTKTGECYGGATPTITVGQYQNKSTGTCVNDPNDSSSTGTVLTMAPCDGSKGQQFTFDGTFFQINNLCALKSGSNIVLASCDAGPWEQWSTNPNGTINDIQTSKYCWTASGTTLKTGGCSGANAQWTFPQSGPTDFSVGVGPASASVDPGGSTTATVTTTAGSGGAKTVSLTTSGAPSGVTASVSPASVTAGGSATLTVSASSTAVAGTYPITVTGTAGSSSHTATFTLTVNGTGGGPGSYEAEAATLAGGASVTSCSACSGGKAVKGIGGSGAGTVTFAKVSEPSAGSYTLTVYYLSTSKARPATITVNGKAQTVSFPMTASNVVGTVKVTVQLKAGANTIELSGAGTKSAPTLDRITV